MELHFFAHHDKNPAEKLCSKMKAKDKDRLFCFALRPTPDCSALEHVRIISITKKKNEFYVNYQASTERKTGVHDSYHESGHFHWKVPGKPYIVPVDGEADRRRASLLKQASDHFSGRLLGYCLAIRSVDPLVLGVMLEILHGLIIPEFDKELLLKNLLADKQATLPIPPSEHLRRIIELSKSPAEILTQEELVAFYKEQFGQEVDIFISDPMRNQFAIYPKEVMIEITNISRDFVAGKMSDRPTDFYKIAIAENESSQNEGAGE